MSPDLVIAIANHHKSMQTWWKIPEYIAARKSFVKRNPFCIRCGRPTTTPGHSQEDYFSYETYLQAVIEDKCDPLCSGCNLMERKGMKPCPRCVELYKLGTSEKGPKIIFKINYIPEHAERCLSCDPVEQQRIETKKEIFKDLVKKSQKINNAKRRLIYQILKEKRK